MHDTTDRTMGRLRRFVDEWLLAAQYRHRAGLEVTSCGIATRERRPPHFEVIALIGRKPATGRGKAERAQ